MPNPELQAQLERIEATLDEATTALGKEVALAYHEGRYTTEFRDRIDKQQHAIDLTRRKFEELKESSQYID